MPHKAYKHSGHSHGSGRFCFANAAPGNIPAGAAVYIDGRPVDGNGGTYSADIGQLAGSRDVKLEIKQGDKVLDSALLRVEVDSSFFGKLSSFFSNFLFNMFSWKRVTVNFR